MKNMHHWRDNVNVALSGEINGDPIMIRTETIEEKLQRLFYKLQDNGADVVAFTEPDINDQLTSICYYGTPEMRKITDKLDLALEDVKVAV